MSHNFAESTRVELLKLRSIRPLWISLVAFAATSIGLGLLIGLGTRQAVDSDDPALIRPFVPEEAGLDSVFFAAIAVIVFGVLAISSEHSSGMIRLSLLSKPNRSSFFLSKAVFVGAVSALVALPVCLLSYLTVQWGLGPHGASVAEPGVARAIVGGAMYVTLLGLLSFGLASFVRNSLVPMLILIPVFFIGTQILLLVGIPRSIIKFSPEQAGGQMSRIHDEPGFLTPGAGFLVMLGWTFLALAAGMYKTKTSDI